MTSASGIRTVRADLSPHSSLQPDRSDGGNLSGNLSGSLSGPVVGQQQQQSSPRTHTPPQSETGFQYPSNQSPNSAGSAAAGSDLANGSASRIAQVQIASPTTINRGTAISQDFAIPGQYNTSDRKIYAPAVFDKHRGSDGYDSGHDSRGSVGSSLGRASITSGGIPPSRRTSSVGSTLYSLNNVKGSQDPLGPHRQSPSNDPGSLPNSHQSGQSIHSGTTIQSVVTGISTRSAPTSPNTQTGPAPTNHANLPGISSLLSASGQVSPPPAPVLPLRQHQQHPQHPPSPPTTVYDSQKDTNHSTDMPELPVGSSMPNSTVIPESAAPLGQEPLVRRSKTHTPLTTDGNVGTNYHNNDFGHSNLTHGLMNHHQQAEIGQGMHSASIPPRSGHGMHSAPVPSTSPAHNVPQSNGNSVLGHNMVPMSAPPYVPAFYTYEATPREYDYQPMHQVNGHGGVHSPPSSYMLYPNGQPYGYGMQPYYNGAPPNQAGAQPIHNAMTNSGSSMSSPTSLSMAPHSLGPPMNQAQQAQQVSQVGHAGPGGPVAQVPRGQVPGGQVPGGQVHGQVHGGPIVPQVGPNGQPMNAAMAAAAASAASAQLVHVAHAALMQAWRAPPHEISNPQVKRRTKTGCLTCRKRRIKCDETHPVCKYCDRSQRICLGYDPVFASDRLSRAESVVLVRKQAPLAAVSVKVRIERWHDVAHVFSEELAPFLDRLLGTQRFSFIGKLVCDQLTSADPRMIRVAGELEAMRQILAMVYGLTHYPALRSLSLSGENVALEKLRMTDEYSLLRALTEALATLNGEFLPALLAADETPLDRLRVLSALLYSKRIVPSHEVCRVDPEAIKPLVPTTGPALWQLAKEVEDGRRLTEAHLRALNSLVLPERKLLAFLIVHAIIPDSWPGSVLHAVSDQGPFPAALVEIAVGSRKI